MWPRCANVPMEEEYLASVVRWRCFASPPPNGDDLYHLVILPMPCTLQELDILFRILQFDNFRFLARASLSLTWFGLVCDALLGGAFLSVFRKVDGGVRNDVGGRRERPPPKAEGMKGWENMNGGWFPTGRNPWKNGTWEMPCRTARNTLAPVGGEAPVAAFGLLVKASHGGPWKSI